MARLPPAGAERRRLARRHHAAGDRRQRHQLLALPEFLSPTTIHFQDWLLDPATNCFYSTQRLTVPIVK